MPWGQGRVGNGRGSACVALHASYPQTPRPCPPQGGYSERGDEQAGAQQAPLDGEPLGGGQLAAVHLHPSEEQQRQEGRQGQRGARTHHWSGREESWGVGLDPPSRRRRQIRQVLELEGLTGSAATLPNSTLPNSPRRPPRNSSVREARHPPFRANARPLGPRTRQLCGERIRRAGLPPTPTPTGPSGGSRWSRYPSRPARGPTDA